MKVKSIDHFDAKFRAAIVPPPLPKVDAVLELAKEVRASTEEQKKMTETMLRALAQKLEPAPIEVNVPAPDKVAVWNIEVSYDKNDRIVNMKVTRG